LFSSPLEGKDKGEGGLIQLKAQSQKLKANSNSSSSQNLVHVFELDVIPPFEPESIFTGLTRTHVHWYIGHG